MKGFHLLPPRRPGSSRPQGLASALTRGQRPIGSTAFAMGGSLTGGVKLTADAFDDAVADAAIVHSSHLTGFPAC